MKAVVLYSLCINQEQKEDKKNLEIKNHLRLTNQKIFIIIMIMKYLRVSKRLKLNEYTF